MHVGVINDERSQTIPKVIQREQSQTSVICGLIFRLNKAPSQFNGGLPFVLDEFVGEFKKFGGRSMWVAVFVQRDIFPEDKAVCAYNFICIFIPNDKLFERNFANIKFIDVDCLSCTTSGMTESQFPQTSNFLHHIGCIVAINDVNIIVNGICFSYKSFFSKFR